MKENQIALGIVFVFMALWIYFQFIKKKPAVATTLNTKKTTIANASLGKK